MIHHHSEVTADFSNFERTVISPTNGFLYGPHQPMSEQEISDFESGPGQQHGVLTELAKLP